jgi:hypothetical protein
MNKSNHIQQKTRRAAERKSVNSRLNSQQKYSKAKAKAFIAMQMPHKVITKRHTVQEMLKPFDQKETDTTWKYKSTERTKKFSK